MEAAKDSKGLAVGVRGLLKNFLDDDSYFVVDLRLSGQVHALKTKTVPNWDNS